VHQGRHPDTWAEAHPDRNILNAMIGRKDRELTKICKLLQRARHNPTSGGLNGRRVMCLSDLSRAQEIS
jgi:hypothetical protein